MCIGGRPVGGDCANNFVLFLVNGVAVGEQETEFWTFLGPHFVDY